MSKLRYKEGGVWKSIAPSQKEFDDNKNEVTASLADIAPHYRSIPAGSATTSPNLIQGYSGNAIATDVGGCVISGGGQKNGFENVIGGNPDNVGTTNSNAEPMAVGTYANVSVIGGGYDNVANGLASVLTGFHSKILQQATHGTISGGSYQSINGGDYTVIAGGTNNEINGSYASISGGANNKALAESATIGGGNTNVANSRYSTINGGINNTTSADYATIVGGNKHTVSGASSVITGGTENSVTQTYSSIGGGFKNTVNQSYACIPGGRENTANSLYSIVIGRNGVSTFEGELTHSAGMFSQAGDSQLSEIILRKQTADATQVFLGPAGGSSSLNLPADSTWGFTCKIVARRTDVDGESAMWEIKGLAHRGTGSTTLVGTPTINEIGKSTAATWSVAVTTSGYAVRINVTGGTGKTINWVGQLNVIQVIG